MNKNIFLRTLRKIGVLKNKQIEFDLKLNGRSLSVPINNEIGFNNHCMDEFWMLDLFKQWDIKAQDVLLDVGANVGQTLLKWKSVNPKAKYIGFEPLPICYSYILDLVKINKFNDCDVYQKALSNENGKTQLKMHFQDETDRTATIVKSNLKSIGSIEVALIDFPTFIKEQTISLKNIAVVKIDTEGSEVEILSSMQSFLETYKPKVIVEVLAENKQSIDRVSAFNAFIKTIPYQLYRIDKKGNYLKNLSAIDEITIPTKVRNSDYLLLPKGHAL